MKYINMNYIMVPYKHVNIQNIYMFISSDSSNQSVFITDLRIHYNVVSAVF